MSVFVKMVAGKTATNIPVNRRFTRAGSGDNSTIRLDEERAPEDLFLLENFDDGSFFVYCNASNYMILNNETLQKGTRVAWKIGETIEIPGCCTLTLLDEKSERARVASSASPKTSRAASSSERRKKSSSDEREGDKRSSKDKRPSGRANKVEKVEKGKPSEKSKKQLAQVLAIVACAIVLGFQFVGLKRGPANPDSGPLVTLTECMGCLEELKIGASESEREEYEATKELIRSAGLKRQQRDRVGAAADYRAAQQKARRLQKRNGDDGGDKSEKIDKVLMYIGANM